MSNNTTEQEIGDKAIINNLVFATGVGVSLFLVYCLIRKFFRGVYSSNLTSPDRPKFKTEDGHFSWIRTTWKTEDTKTLALIGLEGYIFLESLWLLFVIISTIIVPTLLVLLPVYALTGPDVPPDDDNDDETFFGAGLFFKFSILNCGEKFLWFPFLMCHLIAFVVFYAIYLFYRNYTYLRQAYLKNPSALTGVMSLQKYINLTGDYDQARSMMNAKTKAVLLTGVSSKYDKSRLYSVISEIGLGAIESVSFVGDRSALAKIIKERNETLLKLEKAYQQLFKATIVNGLVENKKKLKEVDHVLKEKNIELTSDGEKFRMMEVLNDPEFLKEHRPHHALDKENPDDSVDSISFYFNEVLEKETEFQQLLALNGNETDFIDTEEERVSTRAHIGRTTIISFRKFTWLKHNLKDFKLTMWGTSQSVVVIFKQPITAAAVSQSLLSRRIFSMRSKMSPAPDDLLWDNLYMASADRFARQVCGNLLYVLLILLFANITSVLTLVTDLDKLAEKIPPLNSILNSSPKFRSILSGIMAPLAYNIALALVPMILRGFATLQGKLSKSEIQNSVLKKLSWFYFLQSFIVVMLATSVLNIVSFLTKRNWDPLLKAFRESLVTKSSFFLNFIVQKAFLGTMVVLMKFDVLLFALIKKIAALNWTPREYALNSAPQPFHFGDNYPNYVTFLFQIVFAFMMISPIHLVPALLLFFITYFVFKHQFLYSNVTAHESGGLYWTRVANQIIFGLVLNQAFTLIHFALRGSIILATLLIPLLVLTLYSITFFKNTFTTKSASPPLTMEDEQVIDETIKELTIEQERLLVPHSPVIHSQSEKEGDLTDVSEFVQYPVRMFVKDVKGEEGQVSLEEHESSQIINNPYRNPVLFRRLPNIIMSPILLKIVKYLSEQGENK
jgi:calcium permeable stress-gated cation channel